MALGPARITSSGVLLQLILASGSRGNRSSLFFTASFLKSIRPGRAMHTLPSAGKSIWSGACPAGKRRSARFIFESTDDGKLSRSWVHARCCRKIGRRRWYERRQRCRRRMFLWGEITITFTLSMPSRPPRCTGKLFLEQLVSRGRTEPAATERSPCLSRVYASTSRHSG